ncbi:MAG: hypothetical protein ACI9UU_003023 [Candidatus Azotimanducaceae bacterium]|jgi:hypothetical protein
MPDKQKMRAAAMVLVGQIINWGGQGKDMAEFLGVSSTTISHWRKLGNLEGRKPAVPTDEHILKLIAIFQFRVNQNLAMLDSILSLDAFEPRHQNLLADTLSKQLGGYAKRFGEITIVRSQEIEELLDMLEVLQANGNTSAMRSFIDPVALWGNNMPTEQDSVESDAPIDLDKIREHYAADKALPKKIEEYSEEFRKMVIEGGRQELLKGVSRQKK